MSTTTLTIDGSAVNMAEHNAWPKRLTIQYGGMSTLTIQKAGGPLVGLPDPWLGKSVVLQIDGTTRFAGDVEDVHVSYLDKKGWVLVYQCRDLWNRGDQAAFTDANTLTDHGSWNLQSDDPEYVASRSGRTVGEIVTAVLTMDDNAAALDALGIGGYTSLTPPTLPASTTADLAALDKIPPHSVAVGGQRLLTAVQDVIDVYAPNHVMWLQADGVIRFSDRRTTTNHTFTFETDPIEPSTLGRMVADCYQRVVIRGQPIAEPCLLTLASGGLEEDFAWGAYATSAAAKAAWNPDDNDQDVAARSQGTCSCTDTLNVVLTSDPTTQTWSANDWDQSHRQGQLYLYYEAGSGLNQFTSRRVASNASKASGGSSNFVIDYALAATNYDHFVLYGVGDGASMVYKKYKVVDPDIAAAMTRLFTYGAIWVSANNDVVTQTSGPMGSACWSSTGSPPFVERTIPITFDATTGNVYFATPTYKIVGNHDPSDVRVLLAVNKGELQAIKPTSGYEGTSYSVEGLQRTLTLTTSQWRDPINQAAMEDFAQEMLDSVKDTVVEGQIVYHGLFADALAFGYGASVTGSTYTTGWEGLNLPIMAVDLDWNTDGDAWHYTTTMHCSNRRSRMTSGSFLRPERPVGGGTIGIDGFQGNADEFNRATFGESFGQGNNVEHNKQVYQSLSQGGNGYAAPSSPGGATVGGDALSNTPDSLAATPDPLAGAVDTLSNTPDSLSGAVDSLASTPQTQLLDGDPSAFMMDIDMNNFLTGDPGRYSGRGKRR